MRRASIIRRVIFWNNQSGIGSEQQEHFSRIVPQSKNQLISSSRVMFVGTLTNAR